MDFFRPDYAGGSIVNLMASIESAFGSRSPYPPLTLLTADELAARNVLLLVMDGLGHDTLTRLGQNGTLARHNRGPITSVFPSTTAAAIPVFMTGRAPQQHGLTSWHMRFQELGRTLAVLPLKARDGNPLPEGFDPASLFAEGAIFPRLDADGYVVSPADIVDSPFTRLHSRGATRLGYRTLEEFFASLSSLARDDAGTRRRFVYGYYPRLDSMAHAHGVGSEAVARCLSHFDTLFGDFLQSIAGTDTTVLVTADHGFVDMAAASHIVLADHPDLAELIDGPLSGEWRTVWCYAKPGCTSAILKYANTVLADVCLAVPSRQLLEEGWFGPGLPEPRLASRIGDVALLMKGHGTLNDWLPNERPYLMVGVHGGVTAAEMQVPLILARA